MVDRSGFCIERSVCVLKLERTDQSFFIFFVVNLCHGIEPKPDVTAMLWNGGLNKLINVVAMSKLDRTSSVPSYISFMHSVNYKT